MVDLLMKINQLSMSMNFANSWFTVQIFKNYLRRQISAIIWFSTPVGAFFMSIQNISINLIPHLLIFQSKALWYFPSNFRNSKSRVNWKFMKNWFRFSVKNTTFVFQFTQTLVENNILRNIWCYGFWQGGRWQYIFWPTDFAPSVPSRPPIHLTSKWV